jgi:hypothetical protein
MSIDTISGTYQRAVEIANPGCSNAGTFSSEITQLPLEVRKIPTERDESAPLIDDVRRTWEKMYKVLKPGDLMIVRGGDGFAHWIVNGLLQDESVEQGFNEIPLMLVPEGNANDVSSELTGKDSLSTVLYEGLALDLRPIEATVLRHGSDEEASRRFAIGNFSLGGTAVAAERLHELKHSTNPLIRFKLSRLLKEFFVTLDAITDAPGLIFTDNGTHKIMSDRAFVRGSQIAKLGRTHSSLDGEAIEEITSYPTGKLHAMTDMFRLQQGRLPGRLITSADFRVRSRPPRKGVRPPDIAVQFDGERDTIPYDSDVHVGIAERSYRALTTRLGRAALA